MATSRPGAPDSGTSSSFPPFLYTSSLLGRLLLLPSTHPRFIFFFEFNLEGPCLRGGFLSCFHLSVLSLLYPLLFPIDARSVWFPILKSGEKFSACWLLLIRSRVVG